MPTIFFRPWCGTTLRPRQNGWHFADDNFKCIFLNENVWIAINISLKFVPKGQINNIPALFQIIAWHQPDDKPLSEPMMLSLLTHICITQPQWVKKLATNWGNLCVFSSLINILPIFIKGFSCIYAVYSMNYVCSFAVSCFGIWSALLLD